MSCKTTTAAWKWHYFSAPDIPEDVFLPENNILALPDGRTITGVPFDFPESGIVDMYDIISPRPAGWEKTVLTAEFTAEDSGRMFAGVAADWAWLLRVNGEIIRDARTTGNSEIPVRTDNLFADFPYRKGKNIVTLEVRGGNTMCMAFKLTERKPEPDFIYPPFVSYPDSASSGMSVIFKANRICPAAVDFRKVNESSWQRVYDNLGGQIRRSFRSVPGENACYSALPPAEFSEPHPKLGENYTFPVIITGGPNGKLGGNMQFTGMKIHVTPEKITVCSFDREQTEFDRVEISPSGEILHEISSMPKYNY